MTGWLETGTKAFEADEAIPQYARVKLDADGKITKAGIADHDLGVAWREAFAAGDWIPVRLRTAQGTTKMICSEAVEVGDLVYSETDGEVQDTAASTSFLVGRALTAGSGDQSVIEVMRIDGDSANP